MCIRDRNIDIPSDPSSAAFPIVSSIITPNSEIKILNVCVNDLRMGLYKSLIEMGANISFSNRREINGEPIADISAKYSILKGIKIPKSRVASMIDEFPILSIAAIRAIGETKMEGIEELRFKETDRINAISEGLRSVGIATKEKKDSLVIMGNGPDYSINGNVTIKSRLDHRIAMSFLCLGLLMENGVKVKNAETINSSFPSFYDTMKSLGANLKK